MSYTRFECDEAKNKRNVQKHGLNFSAAATMFEQPHLVRLDTRQAYGEDRWIVVGLVGLAVCVGAFTDRVDEHGVRVVRMISARKATNRERRWYEQRIEV